MPLMIGVDQSPYRWDKEIHKLRFSNASEGGCIALTGELNRDLRFDYSDFELGTEIWLYNRLKELWRGQLIAPPKIYPSTVRILAAGFWRHYRDDPLARIYCDTSYNNWEPIDVSNEAGFGKLQFEGDNNQFLFKLPNGIANANTYWYTYYQKLLYIGQQVNRVTFDWATGADYDSTEQVLKLYAKTGGSTDTLWTAPTGAGSGSQDITLGTKRDYVFFAFHYVGAKTGINDNYWGQITNPKVYGYHDGAALSNVYASEVTKDVRNAVCPLVSSDNSDIEDTTYTIEPLVFDDFVEAQRIIEEINLYHGFNYGVRGKQKLDGTDSSDGKPIFFFKSHDDTTIDYRVWLKDCKPSLTGKNLDNLCNRVRAKYHDVNGRTQYVLRTATDGYLEEMKSRGLFSSNYYRTAQITVDTSSSTKAQDAGDIYLDENKWIRYKGTIEVQDFVYYGSGDGEIPVEEIKPGTNIRIQGIETTMEAFNTSNVRKSPNVFKIMMIDVTYERGLVSATLHLDQPASELALMLAKLLIREQVT